MDVLYPVLLLGAFGLLFGMGLSMAAKVFYVEVDPRVEETEDLLPGANCGGCGFPGCSGFAEAIVAGEAQPGQCVVAPGETIAKICEILGLEVEETTRMVAVVKCRGDVSKSNYKYDYLGNRTCAEAVLVAEGPNPCRYGCLGMGSCVDACKFDAIHLLEGLPPRVDSEKCVACSACVEACPKQLISLVPEDAVVFVQCSSRDRGKAAKDVCKVACTGCKLCAKKCPEDAIEIIDNLPVFDYEKCIGCGICAEVCRQGSILFSGEKPVASGSGERQKTTDAVGPE